MTFNDTTSRNGLIQECEFLTGTGDAGISGDTNLLKHFTRLINARYHQVVTMILDSQDDWDFDDINNSDFPAFSTALTTNRDTSIPASEKVLKIKRVDVTYDGQTWYKAEPFDSGETGLGLGRAADTAMEAVVDSRFSKTAPKYDLKKNSIILYPKANSTDVANGARIKVEYTREVDEFTTADTTQEPGIDEPFHRMIAVGASLDFAVAKGTTNKNDLAAMYGDYEARLRKYYGKKNEDRMIIMKPAYINYE